MKVSLYAESNHNQRKSYYTAKIIRTTGVSTSNFLFKKVSLNVTYVSYNSNLKRFLVENNVDNIIFKELSKHF